MPEIDSLTTPTKIYEALQTLGGAPVASLGQNFLTDRPLLDAMARDLDLAEGDCVIEIGPGLGHLTRSLLDTGASVLAVEKDTKLADSLSERLGHPDRLTVIGKDVLQLEREGIAEWSNGDQIVLAGNLPYYCSSPILGKFFEDWWGLWSKAGVLLQEEVVDRVIAKPGNKTFGRLAVLVQAFATAKKNRKLPPHLFVPRPEITSAWMLLRRHDNPPEGIEPAKISKLTGWLFAERRKTLANNLGRELGKDEAAKVLAEAEIDPGRRAESLSVEEFLRLAEAIS